MAVVKNGLFFFLLSKLLAAIAEHTPSGHLSSLNIRDQPQHGHHSKNVDQLLYHQPTVESNGMYYTNHQHHQPTNYGQHYTGTQPTNVPQNQEYYRPVMPPPQVDQMQQFNTLQQPTTYSPQMDQSNLMVQTQPRAPQTSPVETNPNNGFFQLPNFLNSISNLISPNPTNEISPSESQAANSQYSEPQAQQPNQPQLSQSYSPPQYQVQQFNEPQVTTSPSLQNQPTYATTTLPQQPQSVQENQNQFFPVTNEPQVTTSPASQNQPTYATTTLPQQPLSVQENQNQFFSVTNEPPKGELSSSLPQTGVNPTELLSPLNQILQKPQLEPSQSNLHDIKENTNNHQTGVSTIELQSPLNQIPQQLQLEPSQSNLQNTLENINNSQQPSPTINQPPSIQQFPASQKTETDLNLPTQNEIQMPLGSSLPQQQSQSSQSNSQPQEEQPIPTTIQPSPISTQPTTNQTTLNISSILPQLLEMNSNNQLPESPPSQAPSLPQQSQDQPTTQSIHSTNHLQTDALKAPTGTPRLQNKISQSINAKGGEKNSRQYMDRNSPTSLNKHHSPLIGFESSSVDHTQVHSPNHSNTDKKSKNPQNEPSKLPVSPQQQGLDIGSQQSPKPTPAVTSEIIKPNVATTTVENNPPAEPSFIPISPQQQESDFGSQQQYQILTPEEISRMIKSNAFVKNNTPPAPVEPESKMINAGAFASLENKEFDAPAVFNELATYDSSYNINTEDAKHGKEDTNKLRAQADPSDIHILNLPPVRQPSMAYGVPNGNFNSPKPSSDTWPYNSRPNDVQTSLAKLPSVSKYNSYPPQLLQYAQPNDRGRKPIVPQAASNDGPTTSTGQYVYDKPFDLKNPPPYPNSWSMVNQNYPTAGDRPMDPSTGNNYYKNNNNYQPQQGGRNPIVSPVIDDRPDYTIGYKPVDLKNPPPYPTSWSLVNHNNPNAGGRPMDTSSTLNDNSYYNKNSNYYPPPQGGRNPIVSPVIDDRPDYTIGYKPVDLKNPPPYPTSWSLVNHNNPTASGRPTDPPASKNDNYYPAISPLGSGQNQQNGNYGYSSNGGGYYSQPQQQQYNGYGDYPNVPNGYGNYPNVHSGYGNYPNVPAGGYYPQTNSGQGIPPAFDRNNFPGYGPQQRSPYDDAFAQNMMSAISNTLQAPMQGTKAVFDVTRSNFPNMPEDQQINLTYAIVQTVTLGLRNVLDSFINRIFDMQRVKRDFNMNTMMSSMTTSSTPTGNNYQPATTTTNSPYSLQQMPPVNFVPNVGQQQRYANGFGTPKYNNANPQGLMPDVLVEAVKNTVYSNLPEPYRNNSPQVTKYIQELSLVLASVFKNQINEILQGNASNMS